MPVVSWERAKDFLSQIDLTAPDESERDVSEIGNIISTNTPTHTGVDDVPQLGWSFPSLTTSTTHPRYVHRPPSFLLTLAPVKLPTFVLSSSLLLSV